MNIRNTYNRFKSFVFRTSRAIWGVVHGGKISAFGEGQGKIGRVLIVNLDRQPKRLRRTLRELGRFRTSDGAPLISLTQRLPAVDARDGRAAAATADVDPAYQLGNQLFVQPDARLEECFGADEPVRMTRQEVAVARSHIEAWKTIAEGPGDHVLVLEDDVWFRKGAAAAIDRGWRVARDRFTGETGPHLLYLSYADAGGTAERIEVCDTLFRPVRGLWFLSGYVLSQEGAKTLLKSMPVVGPVDMWINYQFDKLKALALSSPAILQRPDGESDNCYSVLPFLARAGIVDANALHVPRRMVTAPVLAWTSNGGREGIAMALSMLGFRVRAFDGNEPEIQRGDLASIFSTFDALVDPPISRSALLELTERTSAKFVFEGEGHSVLAFESIRLLSKRTAILSDDGSRDALWRPLCELLGLATPAQSFPLGAPREWRLFRDDRVVVEQFAERAMPTDRLMDDSPWALLPHRNWPAGPSPKRGQQSQNKRVLHLPLTMEPPLLPQKVETFPGNLAAFSSSGLIYDCSGTHLILKKENLGNRPYSSGAFASAGSFEHGRFEVEIRAARGPGVVTGFFLHRHSPRQEIDVELVGDKPHQMLVNVYFNPGDDQTELDYGYRGSPCFIELGFDATAEFHRYAIDWRPGYISWSVDGVVLHERVGWDPTPIPHLPMKLNANLWAPRSEELAGRIDECVLPTTATFRNLSIWS